MTPDAQQPQQEHCEHECVCHNMTNHILEVDAPCTTMYCKHDTRSRPHTQAPLPNPTCPGCNQIDVADRVLWLQEHDAAIARTATLKTLGKLQAWRIRRMNGMLKKDVWEGWNEETDLIDSLRSTAQEQQ